MISSTWSEKKSTLNHHKNIGVCIEITVVLTDIQLIDFDFWI